MASPYDLYVRFLVTTGYDDPKELNQHLADLNLYAVNDEEFTAVYNFVHNTVPEPVSRQILDKRYEGDFLRYMKVLEVDEMWMLEKPFRNPDNAHLKLAKDILYDPKLRLTLNALIIKGIQPKDLVQTINLKFSAMLKEVHIELYSRFFCDPRRMTRRAWRQYLARCNSQEKDILFTTLTESLDDLKTKLDLPSQANISGALQFLFTTSYQKAKHYLRINTKEANDEARKWISQTVALADKYEKHRTGDVEDFGKTLQLEFDYLDTEFPSPDEETLKEIQAKAKEQQDAIEQKVDRES